ncbi:MAG: hypothetical protein RIS48_555 [Pseudomonadota bacterium]
MKQKFFGLVLTLAAAAAFGPAHAQQKLVPAQSEITFVSKQMGVPVEGRFRQFDGQIAFEPAKPAATKIAFSVDLASISVSKEADAELPKPVWFNTPKFPKATFTLTQSGAVTTATGAFPIKRLAFKIGENEWADTSMVADEVQVKFKLALTGVAKL